MTALIQASFSKGEIAPALYGRVDTAAYQIALRTARNAVVRAYGGISNRIGLAWVAPVKDHSHSPRIVEFQFKTADTYLLEFGDLYMRVIRNDGHVLEAAKTITGITAASPPVVTSAGHGFSAGDEVFVDDVVGMTRLNGRRFRVGTTTANTFQLLDQVDGTAIDGTGFAAYVSGGTAARVYTVVTPYAIADVMQIKFVQSADVMTLTHPSYAPRELGRTGHSSWTLTTPTFAPSIAAPTGVSVSNVGGATSRTYAVTALKTDTLEESLPTSASTTTGTEAASEVVSWTAVDGASQYSVYLQQNGTFGWLGDVQSGTSFTNTNIAPDMTISPPTARNPFPAAGDWPAAVSYYEQRRVFGGTSNHPDTSYYSQVGSTANMSSSSPPQDNDAITATLTSLKVNEIRHYIPGDDLIAFTSGSEWQINSGSDSNFSAATLKQHPQSAWGCSHNAPIVVGKTILYVTENQASVRSIGFSWQTNGYTGADVTLLSGHLFERYTIVDWTFARSPDPVIHAVRSDGQATATTYNQEQQMTAWTRWDTQGKFERVASLRHSATEIDEAVYFVVRRVINGRVVRFIERTHSRRFDDVRDCFFVDAGTSYDDPKTISGITVANPVVVTAAGHGFSDGDEVDLFDIEWVPEIDDDFNSVQPDQLNGRRYTVANSTTDTFELSGVDGSAFAAYVEGGTARKAVSTLVNLDYLEGSAVSVLADGNVISNLTIAHGQLTLPRKFSRVHVGLGYVSDIETLDIEAPGARTIQGKKKKVSEVVVRFEKSRGLLIGPSSSKLVEMKQREFEKMGDPTALLTGDKRITLSPDWNSNGRLFLRQKYPLPMTILAVIPDLDVGD